MKTVTLALLFAVTMAFGPAIAQTGEAVKTRDAKQQELEDVSERLRKASERQERIRAEIKSLNRDEAAIDRALVAAATRGQALEAQVTEAEDNLAKARKAEAAVKKSLSGKREVLAQVLGALQRMGRNPPPALLVTPQDALKSVRSALLLSAVVPNIRDETRILLAELKSLAKASADVAKYNKSLRDRLNTLAEDEARLSALIAEKRSLMDRSREELKAQQDAAEKLAANALSLETLIGDLEKQIARADEAARAAQSADERKRQAEEQRLAAAQERLKNGTATLRADTPPAGNAGTAVAFSKALGTLPIPVSGRLLHEFNGTLEDGGRKQPNIAVATRPNARVRSPAAGLVVYAGPFRSYGKLLILDPGDGYHIVLSGLAELNVGTGQRIVSGEPVGRMGAGGRTTALSPKLGSNNPVLTIEFRRRGKPVDSAPWWAPVREAGAGNADDSTGDG